MRVTAQLLKPQMESIKKSIYETQRGRLLHAGKRIVSISESLLQQTFRYWNQSGENEFEFPKIKSRVKVDGNYQSGKLELSVHIVVIDPSSGNPHFLWHILDGGRKTYTFPSGKRSPVLKKRKRRRTSSDTLKVDPFPGFTGETFVIHGGQKVKGVEGNNWYKEAAEQTITKINSDPMLSSFQPVVHIEPYKRAN